MNNFNVKNVIKLFSGVFGLILGAFLLIPTFEISFSRFFWGGMAPAGSFSESGYGVTYVCFILSLILIWQSLRLTREKKTFNTLLLAGIFIFCFVIVFIPLDFGYSAPRSLLEFWLPYLISITN